MAKKLRVSPQMVGRWRARFVTRRVDGLLDAPRPGAPRTITDDTVEAVIVRTLETTPDGATHWSTRTLAKATGLSHGTIARIWRAFGLQPHRTKTFTLSPDPLLVEKVRDVVGLYLHPPDHALVLCVDEKSQIQALGWRPPSGSSSTPAMPPASRSSGRKAPMRSWRASHGSLNAPWSCITD